jgi:hypothetical protein
LEEQSKGADHRPDRFGSVTVEHLLSASRQPLSEDGMPARMLRRFYSSTLRGTFGTETPVLALKFKQRAALYYLP